MDSRNYSTGENKDSTIKHWWYNGDAMEIS